MAVDVYLAVGHGLKPNGLFDPGAVGPDNFIEHDKAFEVVQRTARALERSGVTFVSEHHAGASHDPNHVGSAIQANASGAALAVEVHFNASNGAGHGTEALFVSNAGKKFATRASQLVAQALDLRNRGAKKRTDLGFLNATRMTASLVEVCFVDNANDRAKYRSTPTGEAIAQAVCEHLGRTFIPAP